MNIPSPNSAVSLLAAEERQFTIVHFLKRIYFTFLVNVYVLCVGRHVCLSAVPEETRGVRSAWAGVTGWCKPCDISVGSLWEPPMFWTSELPIQLPHSCPPWENPEWLDQWLPVFTKGCGFPAIHDLNVHPMSSLCFFTVPQASLWRKKKNKNARLHNSTVQCSRTKWES